MWMRSADNPWRRLSLLALLTALALALSFFEGLLPLQALVPLPGVKLGLANLVQLYAVFFLNLPQALLVLSARCLLGALFGGGVTGLFFSLLGGGLATCAMALARRRTGRELSLVGVSILGAAAHNCGQELAACLTLSSWAPLAYLPVLLVCAVLMGTITGAVAAPLFRRLSVKND